MHRALFALLLSGCLTPPGGKLQGLADEAPAPPPVAAPWPGTERPLCEEERARPLLLFTLPSTTYPLRLCAGQPHLPAMSSPQLQRPSRIRWVSTR